MSENLCAYCDLLEVATDMGYLWSCYQCTYTCEQCNRLVPYENGSADSPECDDCWSANERLKVDQH